MLFNSLEFVLFFPLVVVAFYATPHRWRWLLLLVASYTFYMAWEPAYGLLILLSTLVDYHVARLIPEQATLAGRRRLLGISLVSNLGMLFSFKYYNLVNNTAAALAASLGIDWPLPESNLLLPVGISFYTFQTIGYTIDVYKGRQEPEQHFGFMALFVVYFPQLVAGPVERAGRLLPQLKAPVSFDTDRIVSGLRLAAWGLFKKVVVADRLAEVVDVIYGNPQGFGGFAFVVGTVFFGYQIYCDFSGYSDIAIGVARVLGVDLMKNFDQPHLSRSMAEIWTRWHISLSIWFRDYIYIPLGGNRVPFGRWALNIMVVMVGSGLWHGAQWSLMAWGAVHALLLIFERATQAQRAWLQIALGLTRVPWLQRLVQWLCTWLLWQMTLVFFRANSLSDAIFILTHLGTGWDHLGNLVALARFFSRVHLDGFLFLYCLLLCPLTEGIDYVLRSPALVARFQALPRPVLWSVDQLLLFSILVLGSFGDKPFVYFQF